MFGLATNGPGSDRQRQGAAGAEDVGPAVAVGDDADRDGAGVEVAAVGGVGVEDGDEVPEAEIVETVFLDDLGVEEGDVVVAAENVVAALRGERPPNPVNPEAWPGTF